MWASLSMPGEQPQIPGVTTLHLLTPRTCRRRGCGDAPGSLPLRPPPPAVHSFHPSLGPGTTHAYPHDRLARSTA